MRLVFVVFCLCFTSFAHAELIERIVSIVNDDIITLSDLTAYEARLRSGGLTDDLLIPDEETRQGLLRDREKLRQKMVDEKLIDAEIKRQNLTVPFERVEQEIRSITKRNDISREQLQLALKDKGLTLSQYQDFIKRGLERQALIEKAVQSKIKVSEDEVNLQFAAAHGNNDSQIFEYSISHVLFLNEKRNGQSPQARAQLVLNKIKESGNFEKTASDFSEDPNFSAGGVLGTFKSGEFLKELETTVKKMSVNDVSAPIQTAAGWHILKLTKKRIIPDPRQEQEKEKIRSALYEKSYKRQFQSWLEQIRAESFVRTNPPIAAK